MIKFLDYGCFIRIAIQDYIVSVASCFNQEMIILNSFPNPLLISGIKIHVFLIIKIHKQCFDKWKELALRLQLHQTNDKEMQDFMDKEKNKYREILHIV